MKETNTTRFADFEQYLRDECCDYEGCLDDEMEDYFDKWLSNLDGDDYILFADKYAKLRADYAYTEGVKAAAYIAEKSLIK